MSMINTGYSMARSEDGHSHDLPRPICENIAGINNKPEQWDEPLRRPPYTSGHTPPKRPNEDRRQLADVMVPFRGRVQLRR